MTAQNSVPWTVTGQQETMGAGPDGNYTEGVRVTFRTASGQAGTVFVTAADYSAGRVRDMINEKVATINEVAGLTG